MNMSLEARNLAYNNGAHVGLDFARMKTESWIAASKALREKRSKHLDLPYAPGERTKWDLYPATDPKAPCFVHIHGGYWQRNSREVFAFLAEGPSRARLVGRPARLYARAAGKSDADHE